MSGGVLYISYDGMLEPLGQSQVLAYLERLAKTRAIDLVSFEKAGDWANREARGAMTARCRKAGIRWHPLRYHKRPSALATAWDISAGSARAIAIALRRKPAIIHARSYVAGLMALAVKRATGARFLFDMRGFWADERADGGLWPRDGRLYRAAKAAEDRLLRAADHIVMLTEASVDELRNFPAFAGREPPVTVIPTCADLDRFRPPVERSAGPFTLGYVGSLDHWYRAKDMVRCFAELRRHRPDARLLVVTRSDPGALVEAAAQAGLDSRSIEVTAAAHRDIPRLVQRMNAGMALYQPSYSRVACAPTKLAEYLGCGVPCLGNAGVGDVQAILDSRDVGITLHEFDDAAIAAAVMELLDLAADPGTPNRCRAAAEELFSLDRGVDRYAQVYGALERAGRGGA